MTRGGVSARNYVLHLAASFPTSFDVKPTFKSKDDLTFCGRHTADVNCQPLSEGIQEVTCKACTKKAKVFEK
jgi:hypothetical protein